MCRKEQKKSGSKMKPRSMMMILFTFSLFLISGPVGCVDVIVYSGGSVIIISKVSWQSGKSQYICKVENKECKEIKRTTTGKNHIQEEKFILYKNTQGFLTVFIRKLKPQDAGIYSIGVETGRKTDVTLKVVNDSCCVGPQITSAYRGQNTTVICNYPAEYKARYKYFRKIDNDKAVKVIINTATKPQNGRFSISDDSRVNVLSVNISDVSEADDGFYLCGVYQGFLSVEYYSYFTEVQLQVTEAPTEILSGEVNLIPSHSVIMIISVCVCAALLLIGGFALMIYKRGHKRTQGSTSSSKDNEKVPSAACVYEEINHSNIISATDTEFYTNTASPTNPDGEIFFTEQPPQDQNLTYIIVSFQKNPDDDDAVTFSKEEYATEYATVQHQPRLE